MCVCVCMCACECVRECLCVCACVSVRVTKSPIYSNSCSLAVGESGVYG